MRHFRNACAPFQLQPTARRMSRAPARMEPQLGIAKNSRGTRPAQKAPASGQHSEVGPRGGKGREVTAVKGRPLPPPTAVFARVLEPLKPSGLLSGKTLEVDSTTLEDPAMRDRKRPKGDSNQDVYIPNDPEARITNMNDARAHLAHKLEQAAAHLSAGGGSPQLVHRIGVAPENA